MVTRQLVEPRLQRRERNPERTVEARDRPFVRLAHVEDVERVTRPQARKAPLLRVGALVSFLVQSEEMPPKYVSVQGTVTSAEPADVARDLKPVVRKYLGAEVGDAYVDGTRPNGTDEIVIRIRPRRWFSRDFGRAG